jgi:hypothetical protein
VKKVPLFNNSSGRFVLLHHELPTTAAQASHWDLMFDSGDLLLTYRLIQLPQAGASQLAATRLPDHRRLYLDYEGDVSGGRGRVTRWAAGEFKALLSDVPAKSAPSALSVVPTLPSVSVQLHSPELRAQLVFKPCDIDEETNIQVDAWQMHVRKSPTPKPPTP